MMIVVLDQDTVIDEVQRVAGEVVRVPDGFNSDKVRRILKVVKEKKPKKEKVNGNKA